MIAEVFASRLILKIRTKNFFGNVQMGINGELPPQVFYTQKAGVLCVLETTS